MTCSEWLAELARPERPVVAACFDTRIRTRLLVGSAARAIRRRLRRLGFGVVDVRRFTVTATPGPLADDELQHAQRSASALVDRCVGTTPSASPSGPADEHRV